MSSMENKRKLAEDYYKFILKYDECFYKKYKEETATDKYGLKEVMDRFTDKEFRPYIFLTKGKEVEELVYILESDIKTLKKHLRMFDYISEQCYDLAEIELTQYYAKTELHPYYAGNDINKSSEEIFDKIEEDIENNSFDSKIFSEELIEKCNILKESKSIYNRLMQVYEEMKKSKQEME